jgi:hypothetical protein
MPTFMPSLAGPQGGLEILAAAPSTRPPIPTALESKSVSVVPLNIPLAESSPNSHGTHEIRFVGNSKLKVFHP